MLHSLVLATFAAAISTPWFSAVLPSANPSSRLNIDAMRSLDTHLGAVDTRRIGSRAIFTIPPTAPPPIEWGSLLRGPLSVRTVVMDDQVHIDSSSSVESAAQILTDFVVQGVDWEDALQNWQAFGNSFAADASVHVRCVRQASASWCPSGISFPLRRGVARRLDSELGLRAEGTRDAATLEVQIVLYADGELPSATAPGDTASISPSSDGSGAGRVLVELVTLRQPAAFRLQSLPHPGMKRVESWAMAKSLGLQPGEVALDPFCGKGSFLVEGALFWPAARFIGVDSSQEQLDQAAENAAAAKAEVQLLLGEACALPLADDSVDAVLSCPPFDRQFSAGPRGLRGLYACAFAEMARVLKAGSGRAALLVDEATAEEAIQALSAAGLRVTASRDVPVTTRLRCVLLLAQPEPARQPRGSHGAEGAAPSGEVESGEDLPRRGRLWWETKHGKADRASWARLREEGLPPLEPATGRLPQPSPSATAHRQKP